MAKNRKTFIWSFIFISFVLLLVFSMNTSFLYPNYYYESGASYSTSTLLIAKGFTQGFVPYVDLFGVNGPIIYFLESIGYFFGQGRTFVFILQVICLSISLIFTYKILELFVDNKKAYILTCLMLIPIIATFGQGNNAEEFCLPLIMISVYIIVNFVKNYKEQKFSIKEGVILGICVGAVCFIRFNNVFPIIGSIAALIVFCNKDRLNIIVYILLGALVVFIPCIAFYFLKGGVSEMIYATFIYNAKSMLQGFSSLNEIARKIIKCIPILLLLVSGLIYSKKSDKNTGILFVLIALFSIIGLITGDGQWRYYIVIASFLPISLGLMMCLDKAFLTSFIKIISLVCLIGIYIIPLKSTVMSVYEVNTDKNYLSDNKIMIEWAKENLKEDEDIVLVDVPASFYLLNDIMPKTRLFANQTRMSLVDYAIAEEIQDYVYSTPTTQMIIGSKGWIEESLGDYVFVDYIQNVAGTNLAIYNTEAEHTH